MKKLGGIEDAIARMFCTCPFTKIRKGIYVLEKVK